MTASRGYRPSPSGRLPSLFFLPRGKPDRTFRSSRRGHELADGLEYDLELSVVSLLQGGELAREVGVGREHLPQAHESTHDFHVDQDGPLAAQHAGEHGDALFGEGIRSRAAKS